MVLVLEPGRASGLALVGEAIGSYQYKTELRFGHTDVDKGAFLRACQKESTIALITRTVRDLFRVSRNVPSILHLPKSNLRRGRYMIVNRRNSAATGKHTKAKGHGCCY